MSKEAMRLALEVLESAEPKYTRQRKDQKTLGGALDYWKLAQHQRLKAITALREALAEQQEPGRNHYEDGDVFERIAAMKRRTAQQEPVAWANLNALSEQINSVNCGTVYRLPSEAEGRQPLYTAPPQRKPLTDEEYETLVEDLGYWSRYVEVDTAHQALTEHVRQVLAAHGIKGDA